MSVPYQESLFPDPQICLHGEVLLNCDECSGYTSTPFYRNMMAALGYDLRDRGGAESVWLA